MPGVSVEEDSALPRRVILAGIFILIAGLLAFTVLQYFTPPYGAVILWGVNPKAPEQFAAAFGLPPVPHMGLTAFRWWFKGLLFAIWFGYALVVGGMHYSGRAPMGRRGMVCIIGGIGLFLALFCPPLLSSDTYAYVSYARLHLVYGQNPYLVNPITFLMTKHEPVVDFLSWDIPTVYGPVWTLFSYALVQPFVHLGLFWQIAAMKLLESAALLAAALTGRRIAEHFNPNNGTLALLAIGLNPLLLIEGPGNGHNDLLLASILLIAARLYLDKKIVQAGWVLGLTVGLKLITIVVAPWILIEYCRGKGRAEKIKATCRLAVQAVVPTMLAYIPFWHGMATFGSLKQRALWNLRPIEVVFDRNLNHWLLNHGVWKPAIPPLITLLGHWPVVLVYLAATYWVWSRKMVGNWLTAWGILAIVMMFFTLGLPFPTYICWFWPFLLTRWDKPHFRLFTLWFALSLLWECLYSKSFTFAPPPP